MCYPLLVVMLCLRATAHREPFAASASAAQELQPVRRLLMFDTAELLYAGTARA